MSNLPGLAVRGQSARWSLSLKESLRTPLPLVPSGVVILQPPPCCAVAPRTDGVFRENLSSTFPAQELLATFDATFLWHRGKSLAGRDLECLAISQHHPGLGVSSARGVGQSPYRGTPTEL